MTYNDRDERMRIPNVGIGRELNTVPGGVQRVVTDDGVYIDHPSRPRHYTPAEDEAVHAARTVPAAVRNGARPVAVGTSGQVVEGEATLRGWCFYNDSGGTVTIEIHDRSAQGNVIAKAYIPTGDRDLVFLGEAGVLVHNVYLLMTGGNVNGTVWIGGQNE